LKTIKNPNARELEIIMLETTLNEEQIKRWFGDKRHKAGLTQLTYFPAETTQYLTKKYEQNKYPSDKEITKMASATRLEFKQVKRWFNKRRQKLAHVKSNFPREKIEYLNKFYEKKKYPTDSDFIKIVSVTKLELKQAKEWFFSKRYKMGETNKKR